MVDIQTISVVIAAASVVVGVVTFVMNNAKEVKLREDQMIIQRFQTYGLEHARSTIELVRAQYDDVEDFIKKNTVLLQTLNSWQGLIMFLNLITLRECR